MHFLAARDNATDGGGPQGVVFLPWCRLLLAFDFCMALCLAHITSPHSGEGPAVSGFLVHQRPSAHDLTLVERTSETLHRTIVMSNHGVIARESVAVLKPLLGIKTEAVTGLGAKANPLPLPPPPTPPTPPTLGRPCGLRMVLRWRG